MRFLYPATIDDSTLVSTSLAEDEFPAWDAGTSYAVGVKRIYSHYIYESIAGSTGQQPDLNPLSWNLLTPTNQWSMFDLVRGTASESASEIEVVLALDNIDSLSMLDVLAETVRIRVETSAAELVYDRTVALDSQASLYLSDLPPSAGTVITITTTPAPSGTTSIASLQLGAMVFMGDTLLPLTLSITDYSKKTTDEFGLTTLVRRSFSRRMSAKVRVLDEDVDEMVTLLAAIRATPVVWIATAEYAAAFVIGYYKDWSVDVTYPTVSDCSLTIEGISETDDFSFEAAAGGGGGGGGSGASSGGIGYSGGVSYTSGGTVDPGAPEPIFVAPSFTAPDMPAFATLDTSGVTVASGSVSFNGTPGVAQYYLADFLADTLAMPTRFVLSFRVRAINGYSSTTGNHFYCTVSTNNTEIAIEYYGRDSSGLEGSIQVSVGGTQKILSNVSSVLNDTSAHTVTLTIDGVWIKLEIDSTQIAMVSNGTDVIASGSTISTAQLQTPGISISGHPIDLSMVCTAYSIVPLA